MWELTQSDIFFLFFVLAETEKVCLFAKAERIGLAAGNACRKEGLSGCDPRQVRTLGSGILPLSLKRNAGFKNVNYRGWGLIHYQDHDFRSRPPFIVGQKKLKGSNFHLNSQLGKG